MGVVPTCTNKMMKSNYYLRNVGWNQGEYKKESLDQQFVIATAK